MSGSVGDTGCRGVGLVHCDESGERVGHVSPHLRVLAGHLRPVDGVGGGVGERCDGFEGGAAACRDLPDFVEVEAGVEMAKLVESSPVSESELLCW